MAAKNRAVLTERDLLVLNFLFEQRVANFEQIANRFFPQTKVFNVYRRLTKLAKAKFIVKIGVQTEGFILNVYGLDESGLSAVSKGYKFSITKPLYKSDSILHDVALVDIRERFRKTKMVVEYYTENVLQGCGNFLDNENFKSFVHLNSDAALTIRTSSGQHNVALEYEVSDKQKSRYEKKLTDYYFAPTIAGVFYICENPFIENLIKRVDVEVGAKSEPKVYTCLRQNLQNENGSMVFTNRNNARFHWE